MAGEAGGQVYSGEREDAGFFKQTKVYSWHQLLTKYEKFAINHLLPKVFGGKGGKGGVDVADVSDEQPNYKHGMKLLMKSGTNRKSNDKMLPLGVHDLIKFVFSKETVKEYYEGLSTGDRATDELYLGNFFRDRILSELHELTKTIQEKLTGPLEFRVKAQPVLSCTSQGVVEVYVTERDVSSTLANSGEESAGVKSLRKQLGGYYRANQWPQGVDLIGKASRCKFPFKKS